MRYIAAVVLAAGLLVLSVSAFAVTATDSADVSIELAATGQVVIDDATVGFAPAAAVTDAVGTFTDAIDYKIFTNDDAWDASVAMLSDASVADQVSSSVDAMPCTAAIDVATGGPTGNAGTAGVLTLSLTRAGLSDANGLYGGTATITLNYD